MVCIRLNAFFLLFVFFDKMCPNTQIVISDIFLSYIFKNSEKFFVRNVVNAFKLIRLILLAVQTLRVRSHLALSDSVSLSDAKNE